MAIPLCEALHENLESAMRLKDGTFDNERCAHSPPARRTPADNTEACELQDLPVYRLQKISRTKDPEIASRCKIRCTNDAAVPGFWISTWTLDPGPWILNPGLWTPDVGPWISVGYSYLG
jgi:hypothetical protein